MSKKMLFVASVALSSVFMPFISNAAPDSSSSTTTPTNTTPTEIPKDAWLNSMMPLLPDLICKGFISDADLKKRFDELKLTYEDCVKMIPESSSMCKTQIYSNIPSMINDENAGTWGKALGECIGKDFAQKHLIPKS